MAADLQRQRVRQLNDETIERVSYPKIGDKWVSQFLSWHPELKSTTG
jgi:hypothetical protein